MRAYPTIAECTALVETASPNFRRVYECLRERFGHARTVYVYCSRVHAAWGSTLPDGRQYLHAHAVHIDDRARGTVLSGISTGARGLLILRAPATAPVFAFSSVWDGPGERDCDVTSVAMDTIYDAIDAELCAAVRAELVEARVHPGRCVPCGGHCEEAVHGPRTLRQDVPRVSSKYLTRRA